MEVVFGGVEDTSPREAHPFDEFIFVAEGALQLHRSDRDQPEHFGQSAFITLPAGVEHVIDLQRTPTKLVIIHPDRTPAAS